MILLYRRNEARSSLDIEHKKRSGRNTSFLKDHKTLIKTLSPDEVSNGKILNSNNIREKRCS